MISADNQVEPQTPLLYLDGSFEIPNVLPGTYLISDIARDMPDTWVTVGNVDVTDVVIGLLGAGAPPSERRDSKWSDILGASERTHFRARQDIRPRKRSYDGNEP